MSRRDRVARLEAGLPDDPELACCLERYDHWDERIQPFSDALQARLDLTPGDADPPLELPVLPFEGRCLKAQGALCERARELASIWWGRRRRLALTMRGLDETML